MNSGQNRWLDRVSAYVDGELDRAERVLFEARMHEDPELRRAVEEVEALVHSAASLGPIEAPERVWTAIRAQIGPDAARRHRPAAPAPRPRSWRKLSLIAAGLAIMVVSGSAGWWLNELGAPTPTPTQIAGIDQPRPLAAQGDASTANFADQEQRLAESIRSLEMALAQYGDRLDPDTREAIVDNLERIDSAIADANRALQADPNSDFLHSQIANSMERKVRLLENATRLASREI